VPAGDDTGDLDRRLAEVELLRRRVLNVIPHALRTPITTFRGLAEAMSSATDQEIRKDIIPALQRLAAQAEHLLDDLLIASGYTTALPTGAPQPTSVAATIRTVWSEVGGAGSIEIEGPDDVRALAPAGSLEKMLVHVLDNAFKYGEGPPRVRIAETAGRVTIDVASTGSVPPDLGILVEPFYRAEAAVMRSSGLGVGLTVADALATQAGGSLTVTEAPGGGGLVTRIELSSASVRAS
jgi:signal transduction histidine kinase